jgi:hypothetical protein
MAGRAIKKGLAVNRERFITDIEKYLRQRPGTGNIGRSAKI